MQCLARVNVFHGFWAELEPCTWILGEWAGVVDADANKLYAALDWWLERQDAIEWRLAQLHLSEGGCVLHDRCSS